MSTKRDLGALSYSDGEQAPSQPPNKRARNQTSKTKQEPRTDSTYGQRCAFPSATDGAGLSDDDLEYEDEADAMAYLASVRTEAETIPHLLVAPKVGPRVPPHLALSEEYDRSIYTDGSGDYRGYYFDGAYTAVPDTPSDNSEGRDDMDAADVEMRIVENSAKLREAYFASLVSRFSVLRTKLHRTPPAEVIDALPKDHEIEVGAFGASSYTFKQWTQRLRYTDPIPAQVAALDRQSTLRLLRIILGGKFLRRGIELRERTSRWIWALLARLPDRGELDHVEVGWVRELGKRAVLMLVSIAQMAALSEEVEGGVDGEVLDDDEGEFDDEFAQEAGIGASNEDWNDDVVEKAGNLPESNNHPQTIPEAEPSCNAASSSEEALKATEHQTAEEGEADMDLDLEDGEVPDEPTTATQPLNLDADIAAAKARLLARLNETEAQQEFAVSPKVGLVNRTGTAPEPMSDETRRHMNMRATLNMILTVAGEFYGQRDLLEFRDPFAGL